MTISLPPLNFTFDVTDYDFPTAVASFGTEIRNSNIQGDFVGRYSSNAGPGFTGQSFVSIGGVMSDLTFVEATGGVSAMDINDSGQIAGVYLASGELHGFVYDGGSVTTIDKAGADPFSLQILGMNNIGQVVGTYSVAGVQQAFMWSSGTGITDIDLSGSGVGSSFILALDINDAGQIVGTYEDGSSIDHGFLLSNGQFQTIAFPDAVGPGSGAVSINNAGQIAGFYLGSDSHVHPFVYTGGAYSTVDMPNSGGAYGISNNGTVAGSDNDGTTHHGFLAEISGETSAVTRGFWFHGVDGNFDDASLWRAGTVPDATSIVSITKPHNFTVTMDTDHTIYKLHVGTIDDDRPTLAVVDATLTVTGGMIDVPGTLTLDSVNGTGAALLIGKNTFILGGCGCDPDIAMGLSGDAGPISIGTAAVVTEPVRLFNDGGYIAGQGEIGGALMKLVNFGQIEAQGGTLTLDTGLNPILNGGELNATPGSTLNVESKLLNGGIVFAEGDPDDGDGTVNINAGVENYGGLVTQAGGQINIDGPLNNYAQLGTSGGGEITVTGDVFNAATAGIILGGGSMDITGTVKNQGTIMTLDGSFTVHGAVKNVGSLIVNSGTMMIDSLRGGSASIIDDGTLIFGGTSNTAIDFSGDAGGNLILEDSDHFKGQITGFADDDFIALNDLMIGASTRLSYNETTGVLRVVDSGGVEAKFQFVGSYDAGNFSLTSDVLGHVAIQHVDVI